MQLAHAMHVHWVAFDASSDASFILPQTELPFIVHELASM